MNGYPVMDHERQDYLRRFLVAYWLRPETALWYAHEAVFAHRYLSPPFAGPSLELGCMDAVSTFIMLGGEFELTFDVYTDASWPQELTDWRSLADDYYNIMKKSSVEESEIVKHPGQCFDFGLSWKDSHIEKARRLGIHKQLFSYDPNRPLTMFEDRSLSTIWAPNIYWLDDFANLLGEVNRILRADGRLVTVLPDVSALDHMLYRFARQINVTWINNLDRGRYNNIKKQSRTFDEWQKLFASHGLRVTRHDDFLPMVVSRVNDIGFRPMFPVFMDIYETLRQSKFSDWQRIKSRWIETTYHFLSPLCETAWMEQMDMSKIWHIFEVRL